MSSTKREVAGADGCLNAYGEAMLKLEPRWATITEKQKTIIRFGMIPVELVNEFPELGSREMALALMDLASADGGMRA